MRQQDSIQGHNLEKLYQSDCSRLTYSPTEIRNTIRSH